jgi:hypothetical protein
VSAADHWYYGSLRNVHRNTLTLSDEAAATVRDLSARAHPRETGGLLLGWWDHELPVVRAAVEVPDPRGGHTSWTRHENTAAAALAAAIATSPARVGYIGEWHSHPADIGPGSRDISELRRISRQYQLPVVLAVARHRGPIDVRLARNGRLTSPSHRRGQGGRHCRRLPRATGADPMKFDIAEAFAVKQQQLQGELGAAKITRHPDDKGDIGEDAWRNLLSHLLPKRYGVSKATVVDANGGQSHAIDIVIHDRHFSPLVFQQHDVLYVPAESVYAAFEVKPELNKEYLVYAADKAASVRSLHRTSAIVVHAGGTIMKPKDPPPMLAGLLTARPGWMPAFGEPFVEHLTVEGDGRLDLGCVASSGAWEVPLDREQATATVGADKSLVFFVMRLLARLQAMGTIPAMDYGAWGAALNP